MKGIKLGKTSKRILSVLRDNIYGRCSLSEFPGIRNHQAIDKLLQYSVIDTETLHFDGGSVPKKVAMLKFSDYSLTTIADIAIGDYVCAMGRVQNYNTASGFCYIESSVTGVLWQVESSTLKRRVIIEKAVSDLIDYPKSRLKV